MQTIQVIQNFVLTLQDGTKRAFKEGVHEVEDEIANHWYTKAHSKPIEAAAAATEYPKSPAAVSDPKTPTPPAGTPPPSDPPAAPEDVKKAPPPAATPPLKAPTKK